MSNAPTAGPASTLPPAANAPAPATAPGTSRPNAPSTAQSNTPPGCGWIDRETGWYIEPFLDLLAGAPILDDLLPPIDLEAYMRSCGEMGKLYSFEMAELLLTTGLTDAGKNQHLKSVLYVGSTLPWKNTSQLYTDINKLRHSPIWHLYEININDQSDPTKPRVQYLVACNIMDVIQDMMGNPAFRKPMKYTPETHWTSEAKTERIFGNMWSANWWHRMQEELRKQGKRGTTIAPLVIAMDQTKLSSLCGSQKAYPVYITLGNIGKEARCQPTKRATVLLGYLPVDTFEDVPNDDERRHMKADLVHQAMETIFAPLKAASETRVEMWCADGHLRRVYPMVAAYLANWPEQNIQSCTSEGSCPVCKTERKWRGELSDDPAPLRDHNETLHAIKAYFNFRCKRDLTDMGLKPVWPWWAGLKHVNLATCLTPDLLHQLYQGIFKTHLIRWLQYLVGIRVLDAHFVSTTQAAGMTHFAKGISHVQQWTGRESKEMIKQVLPLVAGDLKPPELTQLVLSAVDFIYRAHTSSMTDSDIDELDATLETFHRLKELMVKAGFYGSSARFDRIPKLHMLMHYSHAIRELRTPDGYNTEALEHLHIEYMKEPWQALNKVRPLKQMITHIQRLEAVRIHRTYMNEWRKVTMGWEPEPPHRRGWGGVDVNVDEDEDEGELAEVAGMAGVVLGGCEVVPEVPGVGSAVGGSASIAQPTGSNVSNVRGNAGIVERDSDLLPPDTTYYLNPCRRMAKAPTKPNLQLKDMVKDYSASDLTSATKDFLVSRAGIPQCNTLLSKYSRINIWHQLYLHHEPLPFAPLKPPCRDVVHTSLTTLDTAGCVHKTGVWDTVLFKEKPNRPAHARDAPEKHGIRRYHAGQVRAFFSLPGHIRHYYPGQLAYVELFSAINGGVSSFHGLNSTRVKLTLSNRRRTLVVPVTDIVLACHIAPKFSMLNKELELNARTDLFIISKHFWINHYYCHYMEWLWLYQETVFALAQVMSGYMLQVKVLDGVHTAAIALDSCLINLHWMWLAPPPSPTSRSSPQSQQTQAYPAHCQPPPVGWEATCEWVATALNSASYPSPAQSTLTRPPPILTHARAAIWESQGQSSLLELVAVHRLCLESGPLPPAVFGLGTSTPTLEPKYDPDETRPALCRSPSKMATSQMDSATPM
ncbi:hypothetical protein FRC10_002340, partial [Ceratobasidium sp. 414]